MKQQLLCSIFLTGALAISSNALAEIADGDVLQSYSKSSWTTDDLDDWTQSVVTLEVLDDGASIGAKTTNAGTSGWTVTKSFTPEDENSIITLTTTLTGGGASGRDGSYDYLTIGGFTFKTLGQDQKAYVSIDGVDTEITFPGRNETSSISVTINQANDSIFWTVNSTINSTSDKTVSTTAVSKIEWGHYKAGRENYEITCKLGSFSLTEKYQAAQTANYTVNFVDGKGAQLKEPAVRSGVVGNAIALTAEDKASFTVNDVKYKYYSNNTSEVTINADGTATATVTYVEMSKYSYSVKNNFDNVLAEGSDYEGTTLTVPYNRYVLDGTTLFAAKVQTSNPYWGKTITLTSDNMTEVINYDKQVAVADNVVYFSEAEDIESATYSDAANANIRCSGMAGAYLANDVELTELSAGVYTISTSVWGNAGTDFNFTVNGDTVHQTTTAGYIVDATSEKFNVAKYNTAIIAKAAGDKNHVLDYVYISLVEAETLSAPTINTENGILTITPGKSNCGANVRTYYAIGDGLHNEYTEPVALEGSGTIWAYSVSENGFKSDQAYTSYYANVTNVANPTADKAADKTIYTLSGVKVNKAVRGAYVIDGKLTIVK